MIDAFDILDDASRERLRRVEQPEWVPPMLATLVHEPFDDAGWTFERKLDGERCLVIRRSGGVRLVSRTRRRLDDTYPELVDAVRDRAEGDLIADGEIVAFSGGVTSFARLQGRMQVDDPDEARRRSRRIAVHLYLFDIVHLAGRDCTRVPQRDRSRLLRRVIDPGDRVRLVPHRNEHGRRWLEDACSRGWEGLIAKRSDAPYVHGRSRHWLKLKCVRRQELVIGGWTEPEGERTDFGALLVGYHEDGDLVCAGKVGTGFDDATLASLGERLRSRERRTSPFDRGAPRDGGGGGVHWAAPELVAEIGFTEWTDEGRLRHPRFLGLRRDKPAGDVVRERPEDA